MSAAGGTLALVGAGEFLDSMRQVDAALLERASGKRVVILPTASAPDGAGVPERWAEMGVKHFNALGAQAEAVMALDRDGCHAASNVDAVRQANLVYFSGGKPDYLLSTLTGTPLWESVLSVLKKGGVLAGCSAGAMILGGWIPGRPTPGTLSIWHPAFGFVSNAVILPHFDEIPRWVTGPLWWLRPRRSTVIGIDGGTALVGPPVGGDGAWEVRGKGRAVVRGGGRRMEYRDGPIRLQLF
jgi:cyanophycinase-like exopeptidase